MVPATVVQQVDEILNGHEGIMVKWNKIEEILLANGLAYQLVCKPELFLVHPLNRGGTGINPYSMHKKGGVICAAGANLDQLGNAIAFELSKDEATRQSQIEFNTKMVTDAGGMMAPLNGKVRYLTCSKGHTVQFCRAVQSNCKTSQSSLAGADGCLGSHLLKDRQLQHMIEKGWAWTIIVDSVEKQWPKLPSLVESAGNSSNATYEVQNQVELMMAIIQSITPGAKDLDYAKAATQLCLGGPVQAYADRVGKFVQLYGGL